MVSLLKYFFPLIPIACFSVNTYHKRQQHKLLNHQLEMHKILIAKRMDKVIKRNNYCTYESLILQDHKSIEYLKCNCSNDLKVANIDYKAYLDLGGTLNKDEFIAEYNKL